MVLLEEIEFFHRITWKTFQGYTGRRIRVARFIGVKTKDCPRDIMLDVSSVTRWLSSSHCRSSPVPGDAGLHLFPPSPWGGPEPNAAEPLAWHPRLQYFSTISAPIWPLWLLKREYKHQAFGQLWLYFLGLGREQTFFQAIQSLSWMFLGLCWWLPLSKLFPWSFVPLS